MLEGPTENPVPVKNITVTSVLSEKSEPSAAPAPDNLKIIQDAQDRMKSVASGVTGGATEIGVQREMYKLQMIRFLQEKVGLKPQQYMDLPEDLRKAIDGFDPKDENELNTQFTDILQKLNVAGSLNKGQQETVGQLKKAIVDDGILKTETVFEALRDKVEEDNITPEEKAQAIDELKGLQEDLKKPEVAVPTKSLKERVPKVIRMVGLGGLAMLLLSLWQALKETMGFRQG